jgi:NAD(P)-dependent dehydrogenase (short-subunit alcohol dehydrogenase family)
MADLAARRTKDLIHTTRHDLRDKRILVTGGASGLGRAAARVFTDLSARVVIADFNPDALPAAAVEVGAHAGVVGDVTIEADCTAMVARTIEVLGGIDGVLNSAGVSDQVSKALELDLERWQRVLDINLRGTLLIARAAGRIMVAQRCGSIVNISSVNGLGGIPRRHSYGPAKAAVAMLTRNLASEWGEYGVRVNAVAPGYINSPMVSRLAAEGKLDIPRLQKRTPLSRLGEAPEVGHAAAFLLSDAASYISGAILPVDGGWTAYGGPGDVQTA